MINIIIADDHTILTESLSMVLQNDDINVVGVARSGEEALEKCKETLPDIILMDIKMPGMSGIEAARLIKESCPKTKVALLTSLEDGRYIMNSLINGVDGYLLKDTPPEELKQLIKCIYWGFCVLSQGARQLLQSELSGCILTLTTYNNIQALKNEDIAIIRCISEGKSNGEIGEQLGYAQGTVKNKITKLLEVTGSSSRAQLVMYGLKNNLI